ncbi:MAG TPA: arginine--tRNA ligase [Candidatus Nitrosopolaris sp.]|nr:arginine--tRNA ligase [Candidatus Nitrosopolaris sp.]
MTFLALFDEIREVVSTALGHLGYPQDSIDLSEPPRPEFGDVSSNVAFQIGKKLDKKPYDVARDFVENHLKLILRDGEKGNRRSLILSVEAHPGGYINFRANYENLAALTLNQALENPSYGFSNVGNGTRVTIEHTSVNPNKALHIGHLRNIILGDTIYRILKATNHNVTVLNYVDDSGLQVADIVVAFKFAGFPLEPDEKSMKFDHYCGDHVYVKINELYKTEPGLEERRRLVLKELEQGTSELARFASMIVSRVLHEQLTTCWKMKVHYDLLNLESQIIISKLWEKTFIRLKDKQIAHLASEGKNKGCWVIKGESESADDKVIVRSDLTTTYIAKDIPYAAWKLGLVEDPFYYYKFSDQWDNTSLWATTLDSSKSNKDHPKFGPADRAITIIDSRQSRLQSIISGTLSQFQLMENRYHHLAYEPVTISSKTADLLGINIGDKHSMHMSGRKGIYVNADYVIKMAQSKAYDEVRSRDPTFSPERLSKIAEAISISAIRYNLVKYDLDKSINFDIVESLSLEGDTGPYVQYAYARSRRLLEKSTEEISQLSFGLLNKEPETMLIKAIAKLDLVVEEAAKTLKPKSIARYVHMIATAFNLFYETVPVLKEPDREKRVTRLALVVAFCRALKNAFYLLGIEPLNEM